MFVRPFQKYILVHPFFVFPFPPVTGGAPSAFCFLFCRRPQVEDDMILTLNHILLYKEECEYLENRK